MLSRSIRNLVFLSLLLLTLSLGAGCKESNSAVCGGDEDCASDQECVDGVCQATSSEECTIDSDCPAGYYCENFRCTDQPGDPDANVTDTKDQDVTEREDAHGPREDAPPVDETPPKVVSVDPPDDTTGVALNKAVTIEFSEPMRDLTITKSKVKLLGPNGNRVTVTLDKSPEKKVILTPQSPLHQASPYRLVIEDSVQDKAMNVLEGGKFSSRFSTTFDEPPEHRRIAEKWAPWLYQGIDDLQNTGPHTDIPTTVDFDGDREAANNEENATKSGGTKPKAHVYYHVAETERQHYLFYLMYYVGRKVSDMKHSEHHFAASVLIVDKETDELIVAEGLELLRGGDPIYVSFWKDGRGIRHTGTISDEVKVSSSDWKFEDGSHYPMYVKAGVHETCHWYAGGTTGARTKCAHNSEQFLNGQNHGVLIKPGDTAQTFDQAQMQNGMKTMTYKLEPFVEDFWARRDQYGNSQLFNAVTNYEPNSAGSSSGRPSGFPGSDSNHVVPKSLNTPETPNAAETPFVWKSFSNGDGDGQWMLDPAYVALDRLDLSNAPYDLSVNYCHNVFFEIDQRTSAADPACGGGGGGGDAGMGMNPDAGN